MAVEEAADMGAIEKIRNDGAKLKEALAKLQATMRQFGYN